MKNNILYGIVLLFMLMILPPVIAVSSNVYLLKIRLVPASAVGLDIDLVRPNGEVYNISNEIEFRFVANYNRNNTINCQFFIDDEGIETIIVEDGEEELVERNHLLFQGHHTWKISCSDSIGNQRTSVSKSFTIDLEGPQVRINTPNPELTLADFVSLSFTPIDNYATSLNCKMTVKREDTGLLYRVLDLPSLENGRDKITSLTSLDHGNYSWTVDCFDGVLNQGTSGPSKLFVDLKKEFSVVISKDNFNLGEGGVMIINAPFGATIKVLVTNPKSETKEYNYAGPFPVIESLNNNKFVGIYNIEAFMNYNNAVKKTYGSYVVGNTINAVIDINGGGASLDRGVFSLNEEVNFTAYASGGIGTLTYHWNFGDDTPDSSERNVKHAYAEFGSYTVTMRVTDAEGNVAEKTKTVLIREQYNVTITIRNNISGVPIGDAKVYIQGNQKETNSDGNAFFSLYDGTYSLTVLAKSYNGYFNNKFDVSDDYHAYINLTFVNGSSETINGTISLGVLDNETLPSSEQVQKVVEESSRSGEEGEEVAQSSETEEVARLIDESLSAIEHLESEAQAAAQALGLLEQLEKAKKEISRVNRDIFNLNEERLELSEEEKTQEMKNLRARIEEIKKDTLMSVEFIRSDDFIKYPNEDEVKAVSLGYVAGKKLNYNKKKSGDFVRTNIDIQPLVTMSTQVKSLVLVSLAEEREKAVLVTLDLTYSDDFNTTELLIFLSEELRTYNYSFITEQREIAPGMHVVNMKNKKIAFYLLGDIELEKIKDIIAIVVAGPEMIMHKNSGLTSIVGHAVFSSISNVDDPLMVIQVFAIVVLIIVFLYYQFELGGKVKEILTFRDKELEQVKGYLGDIRNRLVKKEIENAEIVYKDLMNAYKALPKKKKAKIHTLIIETYDDILYQKADQKVEQVLLSLKEEGAEKAKTQYEEVKELYKQLSKGGKNKIKDRCQLIYEKLVGAVK